MNVYQGGDLIKWDKAKIGYYVGIDIAEGSVSIILHWCSYHASILTSPKSYHL